MVEWGSFCIQLIFKPNFRKDYWSYEKITLNKKFFKVIQKNQIFHLEVVKTILDGYIGENVKMKIFNFEKFSLWETFFQSTHF